MLKCLVGFTTRAINNFRSVWPEEWASGSCEELEREDEKRLTRSEDGCPASRTPTNTMYRKLLDKKINSKVSRRKNTGSMTAGNKMVKSERPKLSKEEMKTPKVNPRSIEKRSQEYHQMKEKVSCNMLDSIVAAPNNYSQKKIYL